MTEAEALLTRLLEAYSRGDFATFAAGLHDDVDWPDHGRGGRLRQYYTLRDGRVSRMDVVRLEEPSLAL